ncbi:MAG: hypothetical protein DRQ55_18685 [Planctomycetota bacterium]|nr:MAG: hypothetical protein DRQ55_18685 [Planctomycetota bacterium]
MSTLGTPSNDSIARAQARIADLSAQIEAQSLAARKRHGIILSVVCLMGLVMSFGMSQIVALADTLDVDTLAYLGRREAEQQLPLGREALQDSLQSQAPELVAAALRSALDSVPAVRGMLVGQLNTQLNSLHADFESQTIVLVGEAIRTARSSIDQAYPDSSEEDKELRVAHAAASDVSEGFRQALTELYPAYAGRMRQLVIHLERLAVTPAAQLSERDRTQRELIETMLQLAARAES